jgi:integrase
MMEFAVTRNPRFADPTIGVKRLDTPKSDGFEPWSEDDIAAFEARWPIGSRERLAFALLLYTSQRRSDVIRMGPQHIENGRIKVRQAKTGKRLAIPVHPALREAIDAHPSDHLTFLAVRGGRPFASGAAFYQWFKPACAAAGLPDNLSPHGLRKAAARRLAEAGCTPHEIMAVTGHVTLAEAERYTRDANQRRLAESAIARIGRKRREED